MATNIELLKQYLSRIDPSQIVRHEANTYTLPGDTDSRTVTDPASYSLKGVPFGLGGDPWMNPYGAYGNQQSGAVSGTTFGNNNISYVFDKDGNVVSARVKVGPKEAYDVPYVNGEPQFDTAKAASWDTNEGQKEQLAKSIQGTLMVLGGAGWLNELAAKGLLGAGGIGESALGAGAAGGGGAAGAGGAASIGQPAGLALNAAEGGGLWAGGATHGLGTAGTVGSTAGGLGGALDATLRTLGSTPGAASSTTKTPPSQTPPPGTAAPSKGATKLLETALEKMGLDPSWASTIIDIGRVAAPAWGAYAAYTGAKDAGKQRIGAASPELQKDIDDLRKNAPWKIGGLASGGAPANAGGLFSLKDLPGSPWERY